MRENRFQVSQHQSDCWTTCNKNGRHDLPAQNGANWVERLVSTDTMESSLDKDDDISHSTDHKPGDRVRPTNSCDSFWKSDDDSFQRSGPKDSYWRADPVDSFDQNDVSVTAGGSLNFDPSKDDSLTSTETVSSDRGLLRPMLAATAVPNNSFRRSNSSDGTPSLVVINRVQVTSRKSIDSTENPLLADNQPLPGFPEKQAIKSSEIPLRKELDC